MLVTVAICTWNRAKLLDRTLAELRRQEVPAGVAWELVLVDNNCTDDTAAVAEKHAAALPLRRVLETQQGHSHARNRAVDEARGELVLWTDDDVLPSANWIAEYARVAKEFPAAGYFGGRITPWFADEIPAGTRAMIEANLRLLAPIYSLKDYGTAVRLFAAGELPFGANMGYRTDVMRRFRFDPQFGRVKHGLIGADEVSVLQAIQNAGIPGVWIGSTEIQHYIPPERTTPGHFWRYFEGLGRTQVRLEGVAPTPTLFGRPRWAVLGGGKARLKGWLGRQLARPDWLNQYLTAAKLAGYADEAKQRIRPPLMPSVTVAVCTWNRAALLDRTLAHLPTLHVPPGTDWEVLVVNNNSTDDTDAVIARHADRLPLRRLFEPRPGIAFARHRAAAEARGDLILWTDDDALPDPDWVAQYLEAFAAFDADLVFGRIEPDWEAGGPPAWYRPKFAGMFALLDLGGPPRVVTDPRVVGYNVNLGFRRRAVAAIGAYDGAVGSGRMAGGEDVDLFQRAHRHGLTVAYQPAAVVRHFIPASRSTKAFYRSYTWGGSPNHLKLLRDERPDVPRLLGLPRYFLRQQLGYLGGYLRSRLRADDAEAFYCELKLIRLAGLYWSILRRRDPKTVQHRAGQ